MQKSKKYDSDATTELLKDYKQSFPEYYGREMTEEESDWVESLEKNVDDEYEYTFLAYREKPKDIDYESVPFGKKRHFWLDAVYDGFDEICQALFREQTANV